MAEKEKLSVEAFVQAELEELPVEPTFNREQSFRRLEAEMELLARARAKDLQVSLLNTLVWVFLGAFGFTLLVLVLQGFHLWGFDLDTSIVQMLGVATIGEIGGLIGALISAVVGIRKE